MPRNFDCPKLGPESVDLTPEVPAPYAQSEGIPLVRNWAKDPTPKESATAWLGYDDTHLRFYVVLEDSDITTGATEDNQKMWTLGDVVEFFIKPYHLGERYYEIHVTPNNLLMDISIPSRTSVDNNEVTFDEMVQYQSGTQRRTAEFPDQNVWVAEARMPWHAFEFDAPPKPGDCWTFAVCRYNYWQGEDEPELSATALFKKQKRFHLTEDYDNLLFK